MKRKKIFQIIAIMYKLEFSALKIHVFFTLTRKQLSSSLSWETFNISATITSMENIFLLDRRSHAKVVDYTFVLIYE